MICTTTEFRNTMAEKLSEIKYKRQILTIGRRKKKEFVIIPYELLKEDFLKDYFVQESSMSNFWNNEHDIYSLSDIICTKNEKTN